MPKNKKSFFERLTGNILDDEVEEELDEILEESDEEKKEEKEEKNEKNSNKELPTEKKENWLEEGDGQLTVDMYQTPAEIIIQAMVAGIDPDNLDISIDQDMITLKGSRKKEREPEEENYFYKELYWGNFSRSILLPQETDSEKAKASFKNGLLVIRLSKINRETSKKIKVDIS